jgi:hypothetical protein
MNNDDIFSDDYKLDEGTNLNNTDYQSEQSDQGLSEVVDQIDSSHYDISKPKRKILRARIMTE